MRKDIFWAGFSLFTLQFAGVLLLFLARLDYSWFFNNIIFIVGFGVLGLFNLVCLVLMIYGLLSKEEKEEVPEYY